MRVRTWLTWGLGIWIITGIESAIGFGSPGPSLLLPIAAGYSSGLPLGLATGFFTAFCLSARDGASFLGSVLIAVSLAALAHLCAIRFSRRHLLVAMLLALIGSCLITYIYALSHDVFDFGMLLPVLVHGCLNSLWMFPIYGIVLMCTYAHTRRLHSPLDGE